MQFVVFEKFTNADLSLFIYLLYGKNHKITCYLYTCQNMTFFLFSYFVCEYVCVSVCHGSLVRPLAFAFAAAGRAFPKEPGSSF